MSSIPDPPPLTPSPNLYSEHAAFTNSPARSQLSASSATSSTANTPPQPPRSESRSESLPASDGIKSKLTSHVENRPDREQLMKRNIMKAYDANTDPKLQGVMSSLIKTQTEDRLAHSLLKRRSVQELVNQGILMDRTKGTVKVQLAQRAVLRQMERDRLSAFLTKRPTLDELVKTKQNILEDTMTWIRSANMTGSIPLPRNCHTMNSFPNSSKLYLLGGYGTGSTTHSDLLILDTGNDAWIRPSVSGTIPCERYSHTVSSLGNGKLVVFGGFSTNGDWLNDVYVLDTQVSHSFYPADSQQASKVNSRHHSPAHTSKAAPAAAGAASIASTTSTNNSVTNSPSLHPSSAPTRSTLSPSSPPFQPSNSPIFSVPSTASHASPSQNSLLHPSSTSTINMLLWFQPSITGTPPSPRAAHSAVVVGDKIFVFAGNDGKELFNDLHILDTTTWNWSSPPITGSLPAPRAGHTMNLINDRYLVVFGGGTANGPVNELYVLDTVIDPATQSYAWSKPKLNGTPPSPRAGHTSCSFVQNQLLVFGGGYLNKVFNDLHVFNFDTLVWSRPADTGTVPSPRAGHSANVLGSRIYVFAGGDSEHVYNDLFILDTAFLRIQQQAAAYQHVIEHAHHAAVAAAAATQSASHTLEELSMSSLSLGPAGHKGKSQSAPSSPRGGSAASRSLRGNAASIVQPTAGELDLKSLRTPHPDGGDDSNVDSDTHASPTHHHATASQDSLDFHSALSMDALTKLLADQARIERERDESDRMLLQRIETSTNTCLSAIRTLWEKIEDQSKKEEDQFMSVVLKSFRASRMSHLNQIKETLSAVSANFTTEMNTIHATITHRRGAPASSPTAPGEIRSTTPFSHANLEFNNRHSRNNSGNPGNRTPAPPSNNAFHSHSVPPSPYSGNFINNAQVNGFGGMPLHPVDGGTSLLLMHRSNSADADYLHSQFYQQQHPGMQQQQMQRPSTASSIRSNGGPILVKPNGQPATLGTLTVKAVSVTNSAASSTLNSPSAVIPDAPELTPTAGAPPGTPGKARRKRGSKFKRKDANGNAIVDSVANNVLPQGELIPRLPSPMQPNNPEQQ